MTVLQACLNGTRSPADHPAIPLSAAELAADGGRVVDAGADELHVHPRDPGGGETLEAAPVAATVTAIRERCPGTPLGLTTGLWAAGGDPARRLGLVAGWEKLPDYVSVNVGEPGFAELCGLLAARGVGIEAGVWTMGDAAELARTGVDALRILVEPGDGDAPDQVREAESIERALANAGVTAPQLHHGAGRQTWAVLAAARRRGHDTRVGLEDTLVLADGSAARDNAELVLALAGSR